MNVEVKNGKFVITLDNSKAKKLAVAAAAGGKALADKEDGGLMEALLGLLLVTFAKEMAEAGKEAEAAGQLDARG